MNGIPWVRRACGLACAAAALVSCSAPTLSDSTSPLEVPSSALSRGHQESPSLDGEPTPRMAPRADRPQWVHRPVGLPDLRRAAAARVFFGHQSVGGNVLKGITSLFEAAGLQKPPMVDMDGGAVPPQGGYVAHRRVGRNGAPMEKLVDFDAVLRGDSVPGVEVALLKFCYADVKEGTDTEALFRDYHETLIRLERDLPRVTLLHATVPLQSDAPRDNAARADFNSLMRAEYGGTGRLWDLAAIESTTPDGEPVGGVIDGEEYEALYPGFSTDGGHLNDMGARLAAAALLELVAEHPSS